MVLLKFHAAGNILLSGLQIELVQSESRVFNRVDCLTKVKSYIVHQKSKNQLVRQTYDYFTYDFSFFFSHTIDCEVCRFTLSVHRTASFFTFMLGMMFKVSMLMLMPIQFKIVVSKF